MPFPSFLYLEGQSQGFISQGACDTGSLPHGMNTGPEDAIRVDAFQWHTHLPVDPRHGQTTGVWQPGEVTLTKLHDRTTPLLHESLCRGERFARWDIYAQDWRPGQGMVPVLRLQLYSAYIVKIHTRLPPYQNAEEQESTVLEDVTFGYAGFTLEHLKASTLGGGGTQENPGPLAQAYRRTVAYFSSVLSGAAFKDSVRDLNQTLGRALGDPLKGVPGDPSALLGMMGGGIAWVVKKGASKIDRGAFKAEREAFWKAEAKNNAQKYSTEDLVKMNNGRAPTGPDGHPMELHHVDRTPEGSIQPMSRTDHRLGENYKKNHP